MIHVVEPGEILKDIAARFGITLAAILAANPDIEDPELIFPGQKITIPTGGVAPAEPAEPVNPDGVASLEYLVRSGDTMMEIARHFGVRVARLIAANPQVPDPDLIRPGQVLTIPGVAADRGRARGRAVSVTKPQSSGLAGWLAVAKREMDTGVDETRGRADNPRIVEYHKTTTLPAALAAQDETPWCSSFVNWCVIQAGLKGTGSAMARSWLAWGGGLDRPERGAVTVFRRDGGPHSATLGSTGPSRGTASSCSAATRTTRCRSRATRRLICSGTAGPTDRRGMGRALCAVGSRLEEPQSTGSAGRCVSGHARAR